MGLVWNDIDGVWGNFVKPEGEDKQDISISRRQLAELADLVRQVEDKGILSAACTGRSLYIAETLIHIVGMNAWSVVEMGQVLYHPLRGGVMETVDFVHPEQVENFAGFRKWVAEASPIITAGLQQRFAGKNVVQRVDNTRMLTYEFDIDLPAEDVFALIQSFVGGNVQELYESGLLLCSPSKGALDFRPAVDKGDGVKLAMEMSTYPTRVRGHTIGIGDSFHSDRLMMEQCAVVACPANADSELIDYVQGRGGYVSDLTYGAAAIDIYKKIIVGDL
jgi:hydroxymethylpyrimidine pyrophosphatase-like HAD family hydrolase